MVKQTKYTSEITNFIKAYLAEHPNVATKQMELRSTWWDNDGTASALDVQHEYQESTIPLDAYPYFSYPAQK